MATSVASGSALDEPFAGLAWWRVAVLTTPVALVALNIGLVGTARDVAWALDVSLAFLPLHLCHLWFGVRGRRAPYPALTLGAMAVVRRWSRPEPCTSGEAGR